MFIWFINNIFYDEPNTKRKNIESLIKWLKTTEVRQVQRGPRHLSRGPRSD